MNILANYQSSCGVPRMQFLKGILLVFSIMICSTVLANPVWRGQDDSIARPKICPSDQFVVGMRCTGGYCGKFDIQCARHTGIT